MPRPIDPGRPIDFSQLMPDFSRFMNGDIPVVGILLVLIGLFVVYKVVTKVVPFYLRTLSWTFDCNLSEFCRGFFAVIFGLCGIVSFIVAVGSLVLYFEGKGDSDFNLTLGLCAVGGILFFALNAIVVANYSDVKRVIEREREEAKNKSSGEAKNKSSGEAKNKSSGEAKNKSSGEAVKAQPTIPFACQHRFIFESLDNPELAKFVKSLEADWVNSTLRVSFYDLPDVREWLRIVPNSEAWGISGPSGPNVVLSLRDASGKNLYSVVINGLQKRSEKTHLNTASCMQVTREVDFFFECRQELESNENPKA